MRWRTTAILAVLLAGLGTFYYVYEVRQAPEREKAVTVKDRLWKDLEAKDVEEIQVQREGVRLHLKRTGDGWLLVAPVTAKAETRPAEDLAGSLATARLEREIDANPTRPEDFGLKPPAAEVTFRAKGQERGLRLGARNPTHIWVYAQEAGKPAVFLAPESLLRDAQKPVTDYRDRTLLAFERKDVRGLEVKGPAGQVVVAASAGEGDAWRLTAPLAARGDREAITGLLDRLRQAKVKEFVSEAPKSLAEYGLDRPTRLVLWVGEEKSRAARTLLVGKPVPDKKGVYVQREGEPAVFLVEEEVARALPAAGAALRDRTVFAFDRGRAERIELESPKGKVALALEGGAWRITAPAALKADETATGELLTRLQGLRATEFVAEDQARLAAFGLDRPEIRLAVWEKEAKEARTLLLGPGKDRKAGARAYAAATGPGASPAVVAVEPRALAELARSLQDLRDRSLAEAFDTRAVTRVTIERPGQTLALERRGEEDWQLVTPKKGKARGTRVTDLVWALRTLRWKELVAEQGWDAARHGLDTPAATVTLADKDGKTIAGLAVGKAEGERTFVRVPGQPALFAVETRSLGDLPGSADELLQ